MNFKEYQLLAMRTQSKASYKDRLIEIAFALPEETGELLSLIKKHLYHGHDLNTVKLILELGDILWYMADLCNLLSIEFEEVPKMNIDKLKKRYPHGFSYLDSINRVEEVEE